MRRGFRFFDPKVALKRDTVFGRDFAFWNWRASHPDSTLKPNADANKGTSDFLALEWQLLCFRCGGGFRYAK
jgi:hypothetical protein